MTERLYLVDPYLARFEAQVTRKARLGEREAVALDRTAFYPEGGGQPADRGTLGGVAVVDVQEQGGEILHALAGAPPSGRVEGLVDWARRFDHMQQHHGQHLLSAAFERLHRARTVSFHLGEATCTIDLDAPVARLGEQALRAAEAAANQSVWRDLPVIARDFAPDELARLPLRKEPMKGSRVVVVGQLPDLRGQGQPEEGLVDASPCGGTHPRRTGEVGAVAVLGARKWGEGTRVEFVCGGRAVRALAEAGGRLAAAAEALRCAPAEVPEAAARVAEESQARRKEAERLAGALAAQAGERLAAGPDPVVVRLEAPLSGAAGLRAAAAALAARGKVALLGGVEEGRAFLCFARPKGPGPHLGELVRAAAATLGGKGGGAPDMAQGSGPEAARLAEALDLARAGLAPKEPR